MTPDNTSPPAGLDLDAVEALWQRACDLDTPVAVIASWRDVPLLLAEARRLRGLLDAAAQAYDDLVAQVWRATGETHEGPADVAAPLARVAQLRAVRDVAVTSDARREGAEAMREACAERADETAALCDRRAESYVGAACGTASGPQRVAAGAVRSLAAAIRALPLPEVTP